MKHNIGNTALILTSVIAYLEWGKGNSTFLLTAEAEVVTKLLTAPKSAIHPFIIIPLIGQLILLFTLFQKRPAKTLTYIGMICIALLLFFVFVIGIITLNLKTIASTLPFVISCVLVAISYRTSTNVPRLQ